MAVKGHNDYYRSRKPRKCDVCEEEFVPNSGQHRFCSEPCKGKWKYITGQGCTENQYKIISGNWHKYAQRLQYCGGRRRDGLTREVILKVLEGQNYRCALSGRKLTCRLEVGTTFDTNATIDRIEAGGPYTEDNIQIVCRAVNCFRTNKSVEDFVGWCRDVADNYERKKLEAGIRDVSCLANTEKTPCAA
jgi:hypothetical protein